MDKITLNNGQNIPIFGLGTWRAGPNEVKQAVIKAIDLGYRHIDCAYAYSNENEIGDAIDEKINDGTVKREDLFIVTKLWNTFHHPDSVEKCIRISLQRLGLEYIDLYLMHWPFGFQESDEIFPKDEDGKILYSDIDYIDTWKAMENLVDKGLTKSIGVSNSNIDQIQRILDNCRIKPQMLQNEMHPYLPGFKIQEFCSRNGIALTAYSPLGAPNRPDYLISNSPPLLQDAKIKAIGEKYNKSPAQVILRYMTQRRICVIPKSVNPERLAANIQIFDFELTDEDMDQMNSFNFNERFINPTFMMDHKYFPFKDHLE